MTTLILDNIIMTQNVLAHLASEEHAHLLIDMLQKPIRPLFAPSSLNNQTPFTVSKKKKNAQKQAALQTERDLTFLDILESCLNAKLKSHDVLNLILIMQNEIKK